MRFYIRQSGDYRYRKGFLYLPKSNGNGNYRWWENAEWQERFNGFYWSFAFFTNE